MPSIAQTQERSSSSSSSAYNGEIVISGIAGSFPASRNVDEFEQNLFNGVDMTQEISPEWRRNNTDVPTHVGRTLGLEHFDATFFGVHSQQAEFMDPNCRKLLEASFAAFMDAGVNPFSLRGSRTGVYIASCETVSETQSYNKTSGFAIVGISKSMFSNRLSFYFGLNGPSITISNGCTGGLAVLENALEALRRGEIDSAVVGATSTLFHPSVLSMQHKIGILSMQGQRGAYDESADGVVRSEGTVVMFLQRKTDAKRVYATLVDVQLVANGFKLEDEVYPCGKTQVRLLKNFYSNKNIDLNNLGYFESNGSGTIVGDRIECKAIDTIICERRKDPLYIGSVTSNCGHTDTAHGLVAIAKCLLMMQRSEIPPHLHIKNLRQDIDALRTGRLQVVTQNKPLTKPYAAVNCIAYPGVQAHALLKQFDKVTTYERTHNIPRLVLWRARTEENVNNFFEKITQKPINEEFIALVHRAQKSGIPGMVNRGYGVLKSSGNDKLPQLLNKAIQHDSGVKQPLVWVFSGMGSQWTGMGKTLMQLPICRESIEKSHQTLLPLGLNLIEILCSDDKTTFDNIQHCFVGIAAIQIALVDVARRVGLEPDFIIGHSVGELGCAYADNCFTAEQMILASYYRGKVSYETEKIKGSMAAIGLSYNNIKPLLPPAIDVACHNSTESCTISGPSEDIAKFVDELKAKNIFAKEVACSNIAYHSRYIAHFGPKLKEFLKKVIPTPKPRSSKWISTSVPKNDWFAEQNNFSSPEYHTNNLLRSVLFEESLTFLPKNSITVEFAPHSLLQSILKGAMPDGFHIGLTRRNAENNVLTLLNGLGSLFTSGVEVDVDKLYPEIQWPVSRGTGSISSLVDFDHNKSYSVSQYSDSTTKSGICSYQMEIEDVESFMKGHIIDEQLMVPPAFYLDCVWKTFSLMKASNDEVCENIAVEFENVKFLRPAIVYKNDVREFLFVIQRGTGRFEVTQDKSLIAFGTIRDIIAKTQPTTVKVSDNSDKIVQNKEVFYKRFSLRGYNYQGEFRSVESSTMQGSYAKIKWQQNWVTFLDAMLQVNILSNNSRDLLMTTQLRILRIYPQYHKLQLENSHVLEMFTNHLQKKSVCGGVELIDVTTSAIPRIQPLSMSQLSEYKFIPHMPAPKMPIDDILRCSLQIVLENLTKPSLNVLEICSEISYLSNVMGVVNEFAGVKSKFMQYHKSKSVQVEEILDVTHIYESQTSILVNMLIMSCQNIAAACEAEGQRLEDGGFILMHLNTDLHNISVPEGFVAFGIFPAEKQTFLLLRKYTHNINYNQTETLEVTEQNIGSVKEKVKILAQSKQEIILVARKTKYVALLNLVRNLRMTFDAKRLSIRGVFIEDENAPDFDNNLAFYVEQIQRGQTLNVYQQGHWGTYRHIALKTTMSATKCLNHVRAEIEQLRDLSSLHWEAGDLKATETAARVAFAALNELDIMFAYGLTSPCMSNQRFGIEYSGIDMKTQKRIMGLVPQTALSSHIRQKTHLTWELPAKWSLKDAATVPVAYLTAYYAFFIEVNIRSGESILIHSACTDIGLAAIQIALSYGLEVFTTVDTEEKKTFIQKQFPKLKAQNIANSEDISFENVILKNTNGKGVNYVLNNLTGHKFKASLRCLSGKGHFLEIGKLDINNNNEMGLGVFLREISFHAVVVENLFEENDQVIKTLKDLMENDIKKGIVKPLPCLVFAADKIENAFNALIAKQHAGKVLVQIREHESDEATLPILVKHKVYFNADLVYILGGELADVTFELADWMIERGARKLLLNCNQANLTDYQQFKTTLMKSQGCNVSVNTLNIGTEQDSLNLLNEANKLGNVGGIFYLAGGQEAKLQHLAELSVKMCTQLAYFVVITSVSIAKGMMYCNNHETTNSTLELLIEQRVVKGLCGKAIQWNLADVGTDTSAKISKYIESLDVLLNCDKAFVSSFVVNKLNELVTKSALNILAKELALKDPQAISLDMSVGQLEMDPIKLLEIKCALEKEFKIYLSVVDLKNLKLNELKELLEQRRQIIAEADLLEADDDRSTLKHLSLIEKQPLPVSNELSMLNDVAHGVPVIVFAGICGQSTKVWQIIANSLKSPTYLYQYDSDERIQTLNDLTESAFKKINQFLHARNFRTFNILAYSMGAAIAQDVVVLLEKEGLKGKLLFIDSSKTFAANLMHEISKAYDGPKLPKAMMEMLLHELVPNVPLADIKKEMKFREFRENMLVYARDTLLKNNIKNANVLAIYLNDILKRVSIFQTLPNHLSFDPLESDVLLIRAKTSLLEYVDDYYGLEPITMNRLELDVINGNHRTILNNEVLPSIINKFLS